MSHQTTPGEDTVTIEATGPEVAAALRLTAHQDPELYCAIRRAIPSEHFPIVAVLASTDGLEALDIAAGYPPEHDS